MITKRILEHRTNNAYDTILLIEGLTVLAEWMTSGEDEVAENFRNPGDLDYWEPGDPASTLPADYGKLVAVNVDGSVIAAEDLDDAIRGAFRDMRRDAD